MAAVFLWNTIAVQELIVMAEDKAAPWKTFQKLLLSLSKYKVS